MADVLRTKDQYKLTFQLQNVNDESDVVTRDLTFEVSEPISDTATQKSRFTAFRTTYMANYANARDDVTMMPVGSLIQPSSFRDDVTTSNVDVSDNVDKYKCTDITGAYITTVERYFDISA